MFAKLRNTVLTLPEGCRSARASWMGSRPGTSTSFTWNWGVEVGASMDAAGLHEEPRLAHEGALV